MRQIDLEWVQLGITVTATLAEDRNPGLCDLLWRHLPYSSIQHHALISGEHLYHYTPIVESFYASARSTESRSRAADGTVFLSYLQHLSVKYGELTEDLPAAPVARVQPAGLPDLRRVGLACWSSTAYDKNLIEVRVCRHGEGGAEHYRLPPAGSVDSPAARDLIEEIRAQTQAIWLVPPREVLDLHQGRARSRAGSHGQYFSTVVFVNGEERALAYNALGGLLKSATRSGVDLPTLVSITPHFLTVPAEFLGYCGLHTLDRLITEFLRLLPQLSSVPDYVATLSALTLYANKLNGWNLHYFPWRHGEEYAYPDETG